ncbi:hypothetical protein [Oscillibacter sp.]|uniref:hypothetical protein n=1 Tax=Oscillibacter sp. TaxID=1945593 RepID=UPI002D7EAF2F|nr:hypothetical protein [Oscillibacter sp.]
MGDNRKWSAADFAALLWVALHLCTSVLSFMHGLYQTYTSWTWVLLTVWLLGQLVIDVWISSGRPGLLRFVKWYWGLSTALAVGGLLVATLRLSLGWVEILGMICALLTPLYQLLAFAWLLFDELAGLRGSLRFGVDWSAMLAFCLIHFIYFAWLHRRAKRRGEHGPVDPGAGTVE